MQVFDLFNTDHERRLAEGAVDRLEQRRIDDLNMKMDELAHMAKKARESGHPESAVGLLKKFQELKTERDGYYKVKTNEGSMKRQMEADAERMSREKFCDLYGDEHGEFWDNINLDESAIGQDIVNKSEKMARATPQTKAGAVASTVKNAAKWLAGKGGPGKEGPTYEGAEDIADRGEYDREGDMAKDNIHTIVRNARELEAILGDNDNLPEWVQDKLANIKGMMTAVSDYMQTQHERDHEEGVAIAEKLKGLPSKKLGSARDIDKSVKKFRAQRGLEEAGTADQWSKEGKWKKVPKAKSGKPVDPRGEVTHLSDVARREAERKADQKKNSEEVDEGWSDAIVAQRTGRPRTPYSVYINGKKWKDFETDDHAENVANKLRAKFEREGKDPSVVTIAPTDYNKGMDEAANPAQQAAIAIAMKKAGKKPKQVDEDYGSWIVYDPETKQIKKRFKTHTAGKSYAKTHGLGFASSEYYFDTIKQQVTAEDQLDEKWSEKYKRSINCAHPKGFSQKAHCAGRKKNESETFESAVADQGITESRLLKTAKRMDQLAKAFE